MYNKKNTTDAIKVRERNINRKRTIITDYKKLKIEKKLKNL